MLSLKFGKIITVMKGIGHYDETMFHLQIYIRAMKCIYAIVFEKLFFKRYTILRLIGSGIVSCRQVQCFKLPKLYNR